MGTAPETAPLGEGLAGFMKYCKTCRRDTPHRIGEGDRVIAVICLPCWQRAMNYEMSRD